MSDTTEHQPDHDLDVVWPQRPTLQIAGFFQVVVEEKNGAIGGLRLVESVTIGADVPEDAKFPDTGVVFLAMLTLLISVSGIRPEGSVIAVDTVLSNGTRTRGVEMALVGSAPLYRVNLHGPVPIYVAKDRIGMIWFEIFSGSQLIGTIPLEVKVDEVAFAIMAESVIEGSSDQAIIRVPD